MLAHGGAGPAVFTCVWIIGSLRQAGYRPAGIQLSGLAAPDATHPWIMITGVLVLGGCAIVFGEAALLAVFISDTSASGAGVLQRVVVTIPLAVMASVAARLIRTPLSDGPAGVGSMRGRCRGPLPAHGTHPTTP